METEVSVGTELHAVNAINLPIYVPAMSIDENPVDLQVNFVI